ncbi:DUF4956 domain-containing protein [Cellulomonas fimi]|uniref:Permease n=1 Tax=Cellulomonas fimi (strain ATCC 484 / DSM 20113 / JCM 1341 / CCUG 24087 / LMG 16345 / NBRC 15513 / NCIMB 8980 / NCTC 7547 / NRS-133) TaxID=590998 RepID=F4H3C9_CELFA|nr:DUF4956 domain-containing protein [Cellulomonas fimi]AEE45350.1 hypothetical protein Celf_1215 [Cellulomonas fimi ATCC 484]NNH08170.1 DUF4956 domain-containing protein [Cellulomonas fimi]VEH29062.1 Uncharacterised protein [Cellulomonas fimi]
MSPLALYAVDLVAILVLTFALYLPRHRRRDLAVAYLGVNVGVLAVAATLATSTVGAGVGLGLFGVLSIIRLRSAELSQTEVAYYFAALALGLVGGLGATTVAVGTALMALVVVVLAVADSPRLLPRHRQQTIVLDRAVADEVALVAHLEQLLGGRVRRVSVQRLDVVNDTTLVDVRYEAADPRSRPAPPAAPGPAQDAALPWAVGAR